jgi:hypothetical protein
MPDPDVVAQSLSYAEARAFGEKLYTENTHPNGDRVAAGAGLMLMALIDSPNRDQVLGSPTVERD